MIPFVGDNSLSEQPLLGLIDCCGFDVRMALAFFFSSPLLSTIVGAKSSHYNSNRDFEFFTLTVSFNGFLGFLGQSFSSGSRKPCREGKKLTCALLSGPSERLGSEFKQG